MFFLRGLIRESMKRLLLACSLLLISISLLAANVGASPVDWQMFPSINPTTVPVFSYVLSSPVTFATHTELESYGFSFGPSDGQFGAIPAGGMSYTFYGTAGSTSSCAGTPNVKEGEFTFTGTLDQVTGSNGCTRLVGPGDGPAGWIFDADYAGGGQVVRFAADDKTDGSSPSTARSGGRIRRPRITNASWDPVLPR